jgi:hypothetical protein
LVSVLGRHGRDKPWDKPGYPRRQRFKDGADMARPAAKFCRHKLSPLPRSRTFDAPNHVDSRDKPGQARPGRLKVVRRSPS